MTGFLERVLWAWYLRSPEEHPLDRLSDRRWWRIVLHHEAGHAVAWRTRFGDALPIFAQFQKNRNGAFEKKASVPIPGVMPHQNRALDSLIVLTAGALTEEVLLGLPSEGFVKDASMIDGLLNPIRPNLGIAQGDRDSMEDEAYTGFPFTKELIRSHEDVIRRIAQEAFRRLEKKNLFGRTFERFELLSADEVERLYAGPLGKGWGVQLSEPFEQ